MAGRWLRDPATLPTGKDAPVDLYNTGSLYVRETIGPGGAMGWSMVYESELDAYRRIQARITDPTSPDYGDTKLWDRYLAGEEI